MIRYFLLFWLLTIANSCSSDYYLEESSRPNRKFKKRIHANSYSDNSIKPSESMQLGAPKSHRVADGENQKFGLSNNSANNSDYSQDQDSLSNRPNFLEKNESQLSENDQQSGYFKIGNPYSIFGVAYEPQDYESFEETGTASWYGSEFHGKKTANGEIYNKGDITAAHPTLPLPSIIRATNLRNGKVAIVRVNDRGPFAKNRIMDFSEKSAELLDFKAQGTTEVKIELLRVETDKIISKIQLGNKQ